MSDERNTQQQAGGLTEQSIGAQNLATEELLDNPEQVSSSEVTTTPGDSSEEVITPELSIGEVTTPELSIGDVSSPEIPPNVEVASEGPSNLEVEVEVPSNLEVGQEVPPNSEVTLEVPFNLAVEPEVPSDEVAAGEVPLVSTVDQSELAVKTLPVEVPCDPCDPTDPHGLKSDPGCDLPLCKPQPEEPQEDQETLAEEMSLGEQVPLAEEEGKTPGESSEVQEEEVPKETEDLGDPCADPEEPACDFPKPTVEKNVGGLTDEELDWEEVGDDLKEGSIEVSLPEGSAAESQENPDPEAAGEAAGEEPLASEQEPEIAVDPCGPKDPCGFQVDAACIVPVDASLPAESEGELQKDADGTNAKTDREQE